MNEIKNKIITISGEPVSGKSTVVKALTEKYKKMGFKVEVKSVGKMFRDIVVEEYEKRNPDKKGKSLADIQADPEFSEIIRRDIDTWLDNSVERYGKRISEEFTPDTVYIIDSRLAWDRIPDSFSVRLTVDEKIAGRRVFGDKTRGSEDQYDTVEDAIEKTRQRKLGEIERYKQKYGVALNDPENYDLIVDTSYSNTEELADIIINGEEAYRTGIYYPKTWASPVHFLPVQSATETIKGESGRTDLIREIKKSIKQNGYEPFMGELDVDECEGALYLKDGNHRIFAALSAGLTLLPYKARKIDKNEILIDLTSFNFINTLQDWAEKIRYYGGKIGNIKQLEQFSMRDIISIDKVLGARRLLGLDGHKDDGR